MSLIAWIILAGGLLLVASGVAFAVLWRRRTPPIIPPTVAFDRRKRFAKRLDNMEKSVRIEEDSQNL